MTQTRSYLSGPTGQLTPESLTYPWEILTDLSEVIPGLNPRYERLDEHLEGRNEHAHDQVSDEPVQDEHSRVTHEGMPGRFHS